MTHASHSDGDAFKPIAVRSSRDAPVAFALRCVLDLQLLTIHRFLRRRLAALKGRVLDVGAGEAPWRHLMNEVDYVGIDVEGADEFGMRRNASMVYYDGRVIPFPDGSFDHVLCVEVLEHVDEPRTFVRELGRVLRTGGSLVLTVPWSARLHHLPHDYHRFSPAALRTILGGEGFVDIQVEQRGNDVAVVANKVLVIMLRLMRAKRGIAIAWRWPLALLLSPIVGLFLVCAHVTLVLGVDRNDDPLGYGLEARRG